MSPAQLLFGRALADFLPVNPKAYQLHPHWRRQTEQSQRTRHDQLMRSASRYNFGTTKLRPLRPGQTVAVQNPVTRRWDRFGTILRALPHRKYQLRLRDSGNLTLRNRRLLKPKNTSRVPSMPCPGPLVRTARTSATQVALPQGMSSGEDTPQQERQMEPAQEDINIQSSTTSASHDLSLRPEDIPAENSDLPLTSLPPPATANARKEKLALRRLQPFNQPGLKE